MSKRTPELIAVLHELHPCPRNRERRESVTKKTGLLSRRSKKSCVFLAKGKIVRHWRPFTNELDGWGPSWPQQRNFIECYSSIAADNPQHSPAFLPRRPESERPQSKTTLLDPVLRAAGHKHEVSLLESKGKSQKPGPQKMPPLLFSANHVIHSKQFKK